MLLNLVWTQAPESLSETDWIRWLFRNFEVTEHVSSNLDLFKENSIYILSSNRHPLHKLPRGFLEGIGRIRRKGLLHLSDESHAGGYEAYANFNFVLKNYYSAIFKSPGIKILPLGPTNNTMNRSRHRFVAERRFVWSFAGAKTAPRMAMYKSLQTIEPHKCYFFDSRKHQNPTLDKKAFLTLLAETVFSPCPMGNVVLETFRVYESLEMGCIPIVERRRWMPYYDMVMPGHPLPTFASWREAYLFIEMLRKDKRRLLDYQQTVADWWQNYKVQLRNEVEAFVLLGMKKSLRSSSDWNVRTGVKYQAWRTIELLKHANRASLQERIGIALKRKMRHLNSLKAHPWPS
jgi:hypothetical protein